MKFHALFALVSFLAFSTLARSQTSVSTTSFNYCVTAYGIRSISPVPTVFAAVITVSNTKTTACLNWSSCLWNYSSTDDCRPRRPSPPNAPLPFHSCPYPGRRRRCIPLSLERSVPTSAFTGALTHNTNAHSVIIRLPRRLKQALPLLPKQPRHPLQLRRRRSRLASTR